MKRRALCLTLLVFIVLCGVFDLWVQREKQQYARNRQLIAALKSGDTKTALTLVNAGADPNTHIFDLAAPTFKSLLHQLLHHSPPPVNTSPTAFLIACGCFAPLSEDSRAWMQLPHEEWRLVQAMLAHGANLKARNDQLYTALHIAVLEKYRHTVELLLQHGADLNAQDKSGRTPLIWAAINMCHDMMGLLLAHGANPNLQDAGGTTALLFTVLIAAVAPNQTRYVSELLAHGADPNLRTESGETPLHVAMLDKCPDLIRLLKQHGAK